jgi:hypothetical protein
VEAVLLRVAILVSMSLFSFLLLAIASHSSPNFVELSLSSSLVLRFDLSCFFCLTSHRFSLFSQFCRLLPFFVYYTACTSRFLCALYLQLQASHLYLPEGVALPYIRYRCRQGIVLWILYNKNVCFALCCGEY